MTRGRSRHAALGVVACSMVATAPALADRPPPDDPADRRALARTLARRGIDLYDAGRWQEAYDQLRAADDAYHAPTLTLCMARSLGKLGRLMEARTLLQKLLAEPLPDEAPAAYRDAREGARGELDALSRRVPSFQVVVIGIPYEAAGILLDGAPLPEGRRDADPGSHTIEARSADGGRVMKTFTLTEGADERIELALREPERQAPSSPSDGATYRGILIGGGALTAVALGAGVGLTVRSNATARERDTHLLGCRGAVPGACAKFDDLAHTTWITGNAAAYSFLGAGVLVLATGAYAFAAPRRREPVKVTGFVGPGSAAVSVSVEW